MLNLDTIDREILDLEKRDTTYATCERLAWLYIIKDHLLKKEKAESKVKTGNCGESEFMKAIEGKDEASVWIAIDELMDTLRVVNPRLYDGFIRSLN